MFDGIETAQPRQRWTTALSFVVQITGLAVLLVVPLFYTEALPVLHANEVLPPPSRPPAPVQIISTARETNAPVSEISEGHLIQPQWIPRHGKPTADPAPLGDPYGTTVPGSIPGGGNSDAMNNLIARAAPAPLPTPAPVASSRPVRVSSLQLGALVRRVEPVYPRIALAAHVQGKVVLHAIIGRDGRIERLDALSGHPLLIRAAIDAVSQWRYRPYLLNGEPVPVETEVTVNFSLGG